MRESIERVIAELEESKKWHMCCVNQATEEGTKLYHVGVFDGIQKAIDKLKEVLANEPLKFWERVRGTEHNLPTEKEGEK